MPKEALKGKKDPELVTQTVPDVLPVKLPEGESVLNQPPHAVGG